MSDAAKPVEEQSAPVVDAPTEEPVAETKVEDSTTAASGEPSTTVEPTAEAAEPEAAEPEAAAEEAPAEPAAKEFTGEGVLGYKAPGSFMKKVFGSHKKYFWFGSEPVEIKQLNSYLRGEKPEYANHNAAWASQTGNGLLFFSKSESEKASPAGVINLADISEITEDGTVDFYFQLYSAKHVFQCTSASERDSWVAILKTKVTGAVESSEGIKESDGYKEQLTKLSKPAMPVAVIATSSKAEPKKEEKTEAKEEKARKSRSASRKRNSFFGNFSLVTKKEETKDKATETTEAAATTETTAEAAPVDGPSDAPEAPAVEAPKTEEVAPSPIETKKPAISKRNSVFGTFTYKFGKKAASEPKTDIAPAVPAKDEATEPISAEAPVIPAPEASEPLAAVESPADAPVEETAVTNGTPAEAETEEAKTETKPTVKSEKRKSSLPFGLGSKEKSTEVDGEKPKSPFAKFRQTIKGRSPKAKTEKSAEKTEEAPAEPAETPAEAEVYEPATTIKPSQEVSAAA